jgi:hypothetical protein
MILTALKEIESVKKKGKEDEVVTIKEKTECKRKEELAKQKLLEETARERERERNLILYIRRDEKTEFLFSPVFVLFTPFFLKFILTTTSLCCNVRIVLRPSILCSL